MTQDEVDKIYDYLHENYEYIDGELIYLKSRGRMSASSAASSFYHATGKPNIHIQISVNFTKYRMPLAHVIYIFFQKIKPRYLKYLDGNICNTKIENLMEITMQERGHSRINKGYQVEKYRNKVIYRARIQFKGKQISLRGFNTPEEAHQAYLKAKEELCTHTKTPPTVRHQIAPMNVDAR